MKRTLSFVVLPLLCVFNLSAQQPKQENPLKALAEYNLQDVGKFAVPDDAGKAWGSLFQFGRNIAFDYKETLTTQPGRVSGNDPKVWGRTFFMRKEGDSAGFDWFEGGAGTDSWAGIVAKAKDAPTSYKGANGGDPCPKGYHIPTRQELAAFFPSSFKVANFNAEMGKKTVTEELTIDGKTATYQAEYLSNTKHVIYAIKYIGGDNARRTAFRYTWNGSGVSIISRMIGADTKYKSVEDIVKRDFWEYYMANYVNREIPASGMIAGYTGSASQRYDNAYLWTSQATGDKGFAWAVWGYPADNEGYSEGGIAPFDEAVGRYTAASIRCVRDVQEPVTTAKVTFRAQSGSQESAGTIEAEYNVDGKPAVKIETEAAIPLGAKLTLRAIPSAGCHVKSLLIDNTYPQLEGDKLAPYTDAKTHIVTYVKETVQKDFLFEPFFEKIPQHRPLSIVIKGTGKVGVRTNDGDLLTPEGGVSANTEIADFPGDLIALRIDTVPDVSLAKLLINDQPVTKPIRAGRWIYDIMLPMDASKLVLEAVFADAKSDIHLTCKSIELKEDGALDEFPFFKFRVYKYNENLEEQEYEAKDGVYTLPPMDKFFIDFCLPNSEVSLHKFLVNDKPVTADGSHFPIKIGADKIREALGIDAGKPFEQDLTFVVIWRNAMSTPDITAGATAWLYPSVAKETISLHVSPEQIGQTALIFDQAGHLVDRRIVSDCIQTIRLDGLASGSYFLRIADQTLPFIKQ